jgi:hypothetical protein
MAKDSKRGKKLRCNKCGTSYYDLGRKNAQCPTCHRASLIPDGSVARVRLGIKSGGHNDPERGWTDGCATSNQAGAVYMSCQFEVIDGEHTSKQFFSLIGLHTPKGPWWGNKGRKTLRDILNSAYEISDSDYSARAITSRQLKSLSSFDGIEFIADIGIRKDKGGIDKNELKSPVTPDDKRFAVFAALNDNSLSKYGGDTIQGPTLLSPFDDEGFTPAWLSRV